MEQRLEVGADLGAPAEARAFVDRMTEGMPRDVRFAARLLASELVTNAVRHAGLAAADRVTVRVVVADGLLTVATSDAGWGFAAAAEHGTGDESAGLGLSLLTRLSAASSIVTDTDGTTVSFTLPTSGSRGRGCGCEGGGAQRQSASV